jgi:hypothetical protein
MLQNKMKVDHNTPSDEKVILLFYQELLLHIPVWLVITLHSAGGLSLVCSSRKEASWLLPAH